MNLSPPPALATLSPATVASPQPTCTILIRSDGSRTRAFYTPLPRSPCLSSIPIHWYTPAAPIKHASFSNCSPRPNVTFSQGQIWIPSLYGSAGIHARSGGQRGTRLLGGGGLLGGGAARTRRRRQRHIEALATAGSVLRSTRRGRQAGGASRPRRRRPRLPRPAWSVPGGITVSIDHRKWRRATGCTAFFLYRRQLATAVVQCHVHHGQDWNLHI